jgi:hypothetical protein
MIQQEPIFYLGVYLPYIMIATIGAIIIYLWIRGLK